MRWLEPRSVRAMNTCESISENFLSMEERYVRERSLNLTVQTVGIQNLDNFQNEGASGICPDTDEKEGSKQ